jgi:hypothetical protein
VPAQWSAVPRANQVQEPSQCSFSAEDLDDGLRGQPEGGSALLIEQGVHCAPRIVGHLRTANSSADFALAACAVQLGQLIGEARTLFGDVAGTIDGIVELGLGGLERERLDGDVQGATNVRANGRFSGLGQPCARSARRGRHARPRCCPFVIVQVRPAGDFRFSDRLSVAAPDHRALSEARSVAGVPAGTSILADQRHRREPRRTPDVPAGRWTVCWRSSR